MFQKDIKLDEIFAILTVKKETRNAKKVEEPSQPPKTDSAPEPTQARLDWEEHCRKMDESLRELEDFDDLEDDMPDLDVDFSV